MFLAASLLFLVACATGTPPGQPVQVTAPAESSVQGPPVASEEVASSADGVSSEPESAEADSSRACETDADCVPAGCCHPDSCVPAAQAPVCDDVLCTRDCRLDTLDCGGKCLCQEGQCVAQFARPLRLER